MRLALCLITKGDEELESLTNAVLSVYEHVDGVFITTNGKSSTETEIWASGHDKIQLSHLDWNKNFAEQRNFNFSQVPKGYDYILWMDSDDVIMSPELLRNYAGIAKKRGLDCMFFTYIYGAEFNGEPSINTFVREEMVQNRERLIRPGATVWKKRIHETPVPTDPDTYSYAGVKYSEKEPIAWLHLGADRDMSPEDMDKRMLRNRELLELELEDERKQGEADPRTILYLMKIYAEDKDPEILQRCVEMGEEYLSKSGWDEERAVACSLMSKCLGLLGENEKAKEFLLKAIQEYPYSPLLYFHLSRICFNLGQYREMRHWMDVGRRLDFSEGTSSMSNILEMKTLLAELSFNYYYFAKRDIRRAYQAIKVLYEYLPTKENREILEQVARQTDLDVAAEHAHKLMRYLVEIQQENLVPRLLGSLPPAIKNLPFAAKYLVRYSKPKLWGEKEICYYANFGGNHFEKWDGDSLKKGIGGSETAVIRLAEEWTKLGYKVTVYGDPEKEIEVNGVLYKPFYTFNVRDKFSTFIQWRRSNLAGRISAKRFLVDLHDVFGENSHLPQIDSIDKLMVKSKFHSEYAPNVPSSKKKVISNGI